MPVTKHRRVGRRSGRLGPVRRVVKQVRGIGDYLVDSADLVAGRVLGMNPQKYYYIWLKDKLYKYTTDLKEAQDVQRELKAKYGPVNVNVSVGPKVAGIVKDNRRSNPESEAAGMFESFTGQQSEVIDEYIESEHYHGNLAGAGQLVGIKVRTVSGYDATLLFKGVKMALNEKGSQIYFVSGDQELDLKKLHLDGRNKDSLVIGEAWGIAYNARKNFDKFRDIEYVHIFGPEELQQKPKRGGDIWEDARPPLDAFGTGELPTMRYDLMNCKIYFDGGTYHIDKPLFETSPGIEG